MSDICPICRKSDASQKFSPFCSKRCADIDLHRWMSGGYAIPSERPDDDFQNEVDDQRSKPPQSTE